MEGEAGEGTDATRSPLRSTTAGGADPAGTAPADDTAASPPLSSKFPGLGLASLVLVSSTSSVEFACLRGLPPAVNDG